MPVSVLPENIAPTVSCISSDRSILAEPSNDTPCIVLAVASVLADATVLDVSAIVPVVAGNVIVTLPLNALCAGACSLA